MFFLKKNSNQKIRCNIWNTKSQLKTLGTKRGTQLGYLFRYFQKPALSILLIKLVKTISN